MTEKEIVEVLVKDALATQKKEPDNYTEANANPEIRSLGNAVIANSLQFLGSRQIVSDVQPTLSAHGMGFVYRINPDLLSVLNSDEVLTRKIEALFDTPASETSATIHDLFQECEKIEVNEIYRDDLLASLKELQVCFAYECYIACLALSGKILEICLKQLMIDNKISFDDKSMIGQLVQKLHASRCEKYFDQSLPEVAAIINKSRIPAVHSKERIPVPSRDQAIMVIHAVVDTVKRTIVHP